MFQSVSNGQNQVPAYIFSCSRNNHFDIAKAYITIGKKRLSQLSIIA